MNYLLNEILKNNKISIIFYIMLILYIILITYIVVNQNNAYLNFIKKIGKGNNLYKDIKKIKGEYKELKIQGEKFEEKLNIISNNLNLCIQKVGIVKYNAFEDLTGNMSFSMALLDSKNDGIILNNIYGNNGSNIYIKEIKNGRSNQKLTEEEKKAIEKTKDNKNN